MNIEKKRYLNGYVYSVYDNNKFVLCLMGTEDIYDMSKQTFEIFNDNTIITCIPNVFNVEVID